MEGPCEEPEAVLCEPGLRAGGAGPRDWPANQMIPEGEGEIQR